MRTPTTYRESVDSFIDAASWLGDADGPGVMTLIKIADILDADPKPQAALISQFGMVFRDLRGREPKATGESGDPVAAALAAALAAAEQQGDLFTIEAERLAAEQREDAHAA